MAGLEIRPLSDLRDEAALLLEERFRAQRAAEPLLPEIDDFAAHLPETGHVATRGGEAVAYLGGTIDEEAAMARWLFAGHAARDPEALRDLFAHQAAEFGVKRFMVTVPATDPALVDAWFRLAFGCQAVWAVRETDGDVAVQLQDTYVRPATPDDVEAIAGFAQLLHDHQATSPSFSDFTAPPREQSLAELNELFDQAHDAFLAERDGDAIGLLVLFKRPEGDLRVPADNLDLAFAATKGDVRGSGVGLALSAFALRHAHEQGFRSLTVDWRSVNLLSSRFWPRRGFRPQYLRLYRAIP
jgi:ribosomal protein S18 acetylase RimI-like enzyme